MKKPKKMLFTATILTAAINMASCDSDIQDVYGPPVDMDSSSPESSSYDPYYDSFQPEYGITESYERTIEESITTESIKTNSANFDPEQTELAPVYGPPN